MCATGSIGGTFYTAGFEIAGALQELSSTVLRPVPTPGGVENLRLLARGEVDLALTQANLAHAARLGTPPFDDPQPDLQTIGRMHSLDLWIVTPEATGITDLNQLAGRRVSIGTRSGYTSRVSQLLLELYGQDGAGIEQFYLSISQATDALSRGEVDVLFYFTGGMGTAISRLSESRKLRVLSIDTPIVEELCRIEPGLSPSTIASENGKRTAQTIRVETLLVCRGDLRSSETSALWNAVLHVAKTSEILDPLGAGPPVAAPARDW